MHHKLLYQSVMTSLKCIRKQPYDSFTWSIWSFTLGLEHKQPRSPKKKPKHEWVKKCKKQSVSMAAGKKKENVQMSHSFHLSSTS